MKYTFLVALLTLSLTSFSQTYLYIRNSTKVKCNVHMDEGPGVELNPRTESGPFPFKHVISQVNYTISVENQVIVGSVRNRRETPLYGNQILDVHSWDTRRKVISVRIFARE